MLAWVRRSPLMRFFHSFRSCAHSALWPETEGHVSHTLPQFFRSLPQCPCSFAQPSPSLCKQTLNHHCPSVQGVQSTTPHNFRDCLHPQPRIQLLTWYSAFETDTTHPTNHHPFSLGVVCPLPSLARFHYCIQVLSEHMFCKLCLLLIPALDAFPAPPPAAIISPR